MATYADAPGVGLVIHKNVNFLEALQRLAAAASLQQKLDIASNTAPTGAAIGEYLADPNDEISIMFRRLNQAKLRSGNKVPGRNYKRGWQILCCYASVQEAFMAMSPVLTATDLGSAEAITIRSGAKYNIFVQNNYNDEGGFIQTHVLIVLHPSDGSKPWYMEVRYNLKFFPGANRKLLDDTYEYLDITHVGVKDPMNAFEKLHADAPPNHRYGMQNAVFAADLTQDRLLCVDIAAAAFGKPGEVTFTTEGAIQGSMDPTTYNRFAIARKVIDISHQKGAVVSIGSNGIGSNCATLIERLLYGGDANTPVPPNHGLDRALEGFANNGQKTFWANENGLRVRDFYNDPTKFPEVHSTVFNANMRTRFQQPTAKNFATQYCNNELHTDDAAKEYYAMQRQLALEYMQQDEE